ncbi:MAG: F0F1 ATP synthase subunit epsilon [Phycisphaeraceae bacterium]|nr:F0F1 ATP synthase subunit epsilon [Phycisphaeraceae bacterium]
MADVFQCTLVTPMEQVLSEPVTYASVPCWDGLLGVEPGRAPMLIKLGDGPLRLDFQQGGSRWFFLAGGFAQMVDNKLIVLTPEAIAAEQVVRQDAESGLKEALARAAVSEDDVATRQRAVKRGRCLMEIARHVAQGV